MPVEHGLRSGTRDLFSRAFRKKGYIPLSTYLKTYRIGDFVDVKAKGEVIGTKRKLKGLKPGFMVEGEVMDTVAPIPYNVVNQGRVRGLHLLGFVCYPD